jgi:glucosylceramidase
VHNLGMGGRGRLVAVAASLITFAAPTAPAAGATPSLPAVGIVQTSADLAQALTTMPATQFSGAAPPPGVPVITVNDAVGYQQVEGFGAAMTDSSAWLIERGLPPTPRQQLLDELFASSGSLRLSFLRVPIGASDFTVGGVPYSYDDVPPGKRDPALHHFSVSHDRAYILPALRAARALNPTIQLLASPWSPPAWMKRNDALNDVAQLGTLRGSAYGPWAAYIVRFLQAYAAAGVPINALTPANEPGNPTTYPGLNMAAGSISIWISRFLAPALRRARLHPRIYAADYGWGTPSAAAVAIYGPGRRDLSGIAWHCYFGSPAVMAQIHAAAPALDEIVDECSPGISTIPVSEVVISSLRDWASTVALWNLALNPNGGPVHVPDTGCPGCTGLVTINPRTGTFTPLLAYYQLGQASQFVALGARRVQSNTFATYNYTRPGVNFISTSLDDVAFVNPDGTHVLMTYNNSLAAIAFAVDWRGSYFEYALPAGATATFQWSGS